MSKRLTVTCVLALVLALVTFGLALIVLISKNSNSPSPSRIEYPVMTYASPLPLSEDNPVTLYGTVSGVSDPTQYAVVSYAFVQFNDELHNSHSEYWMAYDNGALARVKPDGTWEQKMLKSIDPKNILSVTSFLVPAKIPLTEIPISEKGLTEKPAIIRSFVNLYAALR